MNLSELARQIQKELKTNDPSAIKAALRRYSEELQKHKQKREEKVLHLLKRSSIAVYDRKSVMITGKELNSKTGMKVDLLDKFVYLLDRSDLPERINALMKHDNCTMIVVHSPEELEATPGVVAFIAHFWLSKALTSLSSFPAGLKPSSSSRKKTASKSTKPYPTLSDNALLETDMSSYLL